MLNDVRYATRALAKNPAFSAIAGVTLAIGIGANTAIFSVINGVLLRSLPFDDPDRLVRVWTSTRDESQDSHSAGDFLDLQRENQSLAAIAGYRTAPFGAQAKQGEARTFTGAYVTVDFFDVLQVRAALGRTFSRTVDAVPSEPLVVLAHEAQQQLFGADASAIGQRIRLNGEPHAVAGVLPRGAEWPDRTQVWVLSAKPVPPSPLDIAGAEVDRDVRYFDAIARLKPGISLAQARDDLSRVAAAIQQRHPATAARRELRAGQLRDQMVGAVRPALLVLQAAVGLVLLIACANVSSLCIARATGRHRELTIRAALGATRGRLLRELLTESLLLGAAGGIAGLLLGAWLVALLVRVLPAGVPRADGIALDWLVALATMAGALGTGVLFGVLPAFQASRAEASAALRSGGGRASAARSRGRAILVVAEIALTLVLLVGAGLLVNSFLRLQRVDSGFAPEHVTLMSLALPQSRYPTAASQSQLFRRLVEGLEQRPEVQAVGVGFPAPLRGANASGAFFIEGRSSGSRADRPFANIGSISGGYLRAVGVPLVAGRLFSESDGADAPSVAIVSLALARKYWPGEQAVGKRLRFDPESDWTTVVGVVGDARQRGLHEAPPPVLYFPYRQFALPFTTLAVRSTAPESTIASLMRAQVTTADPSLPPGDLSSLQQVLDRSVAEPRFRTLLLGAFAVMALVLATVGVYGLISYSVAQRTREIGIRVALGAQPRQVLLPAVREGLVLAVAGVAIGLAGALAAARVLSQFLFGVSATDPATFAGVSSLLLAVALLASYIPSRRALRVDPISALRTD
jgi:putative ABC transport system permease protein